MEILLIIIVLILAGTVIYGLVGNNFKLFPTRPQEDSAQKLMLDVIEKLRKTMEDGASKNREELQARLDTITKQLTDHQHRSVETMKTTMQTQFGQSAKIIEEVTKKLTKLDETNRQVVGFAEQMKSLENILKNPKQRGILGEFLLESLLGNVLAPQQYKMQYKFKNGDIVDAVVFFNGKIIPIDAKFSLEKYNLLMRENNKTRREELEKEFKMDLKNRIDETSKYIRPVEDTTEFALMFIPAEGIYYNLLVYNVGAVEVNAQDLIEYAFKKHVIIVSPTSFFAYLETVLHGLKAMKMEESVRDIVKNVGELSRHLNSYQTYMVKLGTNLGTTVSMYNQASQEFKKIDKDVIRMTDGKDSVDAKVMLLEKPKEVP